MLDTPCSCGDMNKHVIARRLTADNYWVKIWQDGVVTDNFGIFLKGLGVCRSKTSRERRKRAVMLLMDSFGVLDWDEIVPAIKLAEITIYQTYDNDDMRLSHVMYKLAKGKENGNTI